MHKNKVLFFGNTPNDTDSRSFGGATVLAKNILSFLKKSNQIEIEHTDIRNTWKPKVHLIDHLLWIFKFPFKIRKFNVISFHTTWDFNLTVGPILWFIAKLSNKKIIYHFFGGDFYKKYNRLPGVVKYIYNKTILNSNSIFFETKESIDYFTKKGIKNLYWLPNARIRTNNFIIEKKYNKKFVFISRVINEKGVNEIIKTSNLLSSDYTIDIYGPIDERNFDKNNFKNSKACYKGELLPSEVNNVLNQYDVLLLPTYFKGEGYPGIIIEALSFGIPCITTSWNAIPEIITNMENGILIPIKDINTLKIAIETIDDNIYQNLRLNAFLSFNNFDQEIVFKKILNSYLK